MYQDAGGTTPAVADTDPVILWKNQMQDAYHAAAPDDASRPLLKLAIVNGKPVLRFVNTNTLMSIAAFPTSAYNAAFSYYIITANSVSGGQGTVLSYNFTAGGNMFAVKRNLTNNLPYFTNTYISEIRWNAVGQNAGVFVGSHNKVTDLYLSNGIYVTVTNATDVGFTNKPLYIGMNDSANTAYGLSGDILEIGVINLALTKAMMQQIQAYAVREYGITTATRKVVFDGDSLTLGTGSSGGNTYPKQVADNYNASFYYWNLGVFGSTTAALITRLATASYCDNVAINNTSADVPCIFACLIGTNDINGAIDAATIIANITSIHTARKAAGFKTIVCTIFARSAFDATEELVRAAVNADILANGATYGSAVCDLAGDARLQNPADTTYFDADGTHLNNAGYGVVASLVKAVIDTL